MAFFMGTSSRPVSYIAKKAIRVVSLSDYLSHTDPMFKELKLLTLDDNVHTTKIQISAQIGS